MVTQVAKHSPFVVTAIEVFLKVLDVSGVSQMAQAVLFGGAYQSVYRLGLPQILSALEPFNT